jgi:hypothetical protein
MMISIKTITVSLLCASTLLSYGQSDCPAPDHRQASQPFLDHIAAVNQFTYGNNNQAEGAQGWSIYPVLRLRSVKANEEKTSFTLTPGDEAFLMNDKGQTIWCGLSTGSPEVMGAVSTLAQHEMEKPGGLRKDAFFLRLLGYDSSPFDVLVYCDNNHLVIEDDRENEYASVDDFLTGHYGSLKKYSELVEESDAKERILKKMPVDNMEEAREVIASSGYLRSKYLPNDSTGNFDLVIKDLNKAILLTPEQSTLIVSKLRDQFGQWARIGLKGEQIEKIFPTSGLKGYSMMHFDINDLVSSVLTSAQNLQWQWWLDVQHKQLIAAENMMDQSIGTGGSAKEDRHSLYEEKLKSIFVH